MRTSCILSHYNYGEYVEEAYESALGQGRPLDEILLVDDGPTDGSFERLRSRYGGTGPVRLLEKAHGGQLSCFNAGFRASTGDIILDADDAYEPGYVEAVVEIYGRRSDVDVVFAAHRTFGTIERVRSEGTGDRDLGYSVVRTLARRRWIGAPTSCLSMRRRVLEKILPLPFEEDWTVRADDCLVFGASIVGARKYYVDRPLVRYRLHARNARAGRPYDAAADYRRKLAPARLVAHWEGAPVTTGAACPSSPTGSSARSSARGSENCATMRGSPPRPRLPGVGGWASWARSSVTTPSRGAIPESGAASFQSRPPVDPSPEPRDNGGLRRRLG